MKSLKNIFFGTVTLLFFSNIAAQDYDHWVIDLGAGIHEIGAPLSPGYNQNMLGQGNFGLRYMFNEKFGLRLDLGYNRFVDDEKVSPAFSSNYYRASLEGVTNLGNVLQFYNWTSRLNLLIHGGFGVGILNTIEPVKSGDETMFTLNVGVTPQFRISNRIALFADFSSVINFNQPVNFDGTSVTTDNRESNVSIFNTSLGLSISFGRNRRLADFYFEKETPVEAELNAIKKRLQSAEKEIANLKVKESVVDKDLLLTELDTRYVKKEELAQYQGGTVTSSNVDFIRELLNRGYVNVYFDVNKSSVQNESLYAVNYIKQFMLDNPYVTATLIGYADETGGEGYNQKLSENRAKRVYEILVGAGINASRLSYVGIGEDRSVTKDARQLARKVAFSINK